MHFQHTLAFTQWERNLGNHYTDKQWQKSLQSTYEAMKYTALWELTQTLYKGDT